MRTIAIRNRNITNVMANRLIAIITLNRISGIHYPERNVIIETPRIVEKQLVLQIQHV